MKETISENEVIHSEQARNSNEIRYCRRCGNRIDLRTKKSTGCNKQYLRLPRKVLIWFFLGLIIVGLLSLNAYQYFQNLEIKSDLELLTSKITQDNPEINNYTEQCTKTTVDELFTSPELYDGMDVAVTAWIAFYAKSETPLKEEVYLIYLVSDKSCFVAKNGSLTPGSTLGALQYYLGYLEPNKTPYIDAILYETDFTESINAIEKKITIYGQFSYNPAYDEGVVITDTKPYQLRVYEYDIK